MRASMLSQWAVFCAAVSVVAGCSLPSNLRDPDWDGRGASDDASAVDTGVLDTVVTGDDVVVGDTGVGADVVAPTCNGTPSAPVPVAPVQGAVLAASGATLTVRAPNADRVEFRIADTRDGLTTAMVQSVPVIAGLAELRVLVSSRNRGQVWSAVARCGAMATAPTVRSFRAGAREPSMWPRNTFEHVELDLNTDGRTDIAFVSGVEGPGSSGVHASIGGAAMPTTATVLASVGVAEGLDAIYSIGDFHGDGSSDVLVAYPHTVTGRVVLFDGGPFGLDSATVRDGSITFNRTMISSWVARAVAALGDINGDGRSDIAVATYDTVYIVLGTAKPAGPAATTLSASAVLDVGMSFGGISSLAAGDFDGDGDVDIAVGGAAAEATAGHVLLYQNTNGTFPTSATRDLSVAGSALLGARVIAGAFANDGSIDLVATSLGRSNPPPLPAVHVWTQPFVAGVAPMVVVPAGNLTASSQFGQHITSSGDVDGDGYSELIVLAAAFPNTATSQGIGIVFEANGPMRPLVEIGRIVPSLSSQSYRGALSGCGTYGGSNSFCVAFSNPAATVGVNSNWGEVYLRGYSAASGAFSTSAGATLTTNSRNTQFCGRSICGG